MIRDTLTENDTSDASTALETLHDNDCRLILSEFEESRTVGDLLKRCETPRSTLYLTLDQLSEADVVHESIEIRHDGGHASRSQLDFEGVTIARDDGIALEVEIKRPPKRIDE